MNPPSHLLPLYFLGIGGLQAHVPFTVAPCRVVKSAIGWLARSLRLLAITAHCVGLCRVPWRLRFGAGAAVARIAASGWGMWYFYRLVYPRSFRTWGGRVQAGVSVFTDRNGRASCAVWVSANPCSPVDQDAAHLDGKKPLGLVLATSCR